MSECDEEGHDWTLPVRINPWEWRRACRVCRLRVVEDEE